MTRRDPCRLHGTFDLVGFRPCDAGDFPSLNYMATSGLGQPGPPKPSLLSTEPGPAWPSQPLTSIGKSLTLFDGPWASPAPNPSLLSADPSVLLARPLTSISQARPPAGLRPKPFRGQILRKESLWEQNRHRHMFRKLATILATA